VTETERTVARGAAAPAAVNGRHDEGRPARSDDAGDGRPLGEAGRGDEPLDGPRSNDADDGRPLGEAGRGDEPLARPRSNGRTAATAVVPPTRAPRTERKPGATLPLGDRPRRRRPGRAATVLAGLLALGSAAAAVVLLAGSGGGVDPQRLPGAPVEDGEVEALAQDFAAAYGDEDGAELGRLLTRDVERVVPGARQEGRAAVLRAYRRQFQDSETRSFELRDLETAGGASGRASARFVATYEGEPDVTGSIVLGVVRDRGTPRIALISARQDA
jgi:hypothetical protein